MMGKKDNAERTQMEIASLEDLVPRNHLVRKLDEAIDMSFIYEEGKDLYSDFGRESIDPVVLIKIAMIQYIFGIPSMRKTIREIEVNFAYRWYLGYGMHEEIPHFSTFGKNYSRRFKDTDLFEKIFSKILSEVAANGFLDTESLFIDGTHIKASANSHKYQNEVIRKEARSYEKELQEEIKRDRQEHGKKPLKEKEPEMITQKVSTTDPDSGWFHKGEHKQVFAYAANTCCDKNNYVLDFEVTAGNIHDSVSFWHLYRRLRQNWKYGIYCVMDAGYKIPSIARQLIKDGKTPVMPYKRPMTQAGFFKKYDFVYDEFFDCYLCPDHKVLHYTTTNREGYREYKSDWLICQSCPHRDHCTNSKDSVKVITRHVWENYMEQVEEIRHTIGMKERYKQRKETIERVFADAKEKHGMRYTQYRGLAKIKMELNLLFGCMNLKKLAIWKWRIKWGAKYRSSSLQFFCSSIKFEFENWKWVKKRFADMTSRTVLSTVCNILDGMKDSVLLVTGLMLIFGGWFCFFAKDLLPTYYDTNKINYVSQGIFRMHVPGLSFNNGNWSYICTTFKVWTRATSIIYPLISILVINLFDIQLWNAIKNILVWVIIIGMLGLVYLVGKKYE